MATRSPFGLALLIFAGCGTSPVTPGEPVSDLGSTDSGVTDLGDTPLIDAPDGCPPSLCAEEGPVSCTPDGWTECARDEFGCLVVFQISCANGESCEPATLECVPSDPCAGEAECELGERWCNGDQVVECGQDARGCLLESTEPCADGFTCVEGDRGAICVDEPCGGVEPCGSDVSYCDETGTLVSCESNPFGCFGEVRTECLVPGSCIETDLGATCEVIDPCGPPMCDPGTFCDGDVLVECTFDALGCLQRTAVECGERGAYCDEELALCVFDPCGDVPPPCEEEGRRCIAPDRMVECSRSAEGCFELIDISCEGESTCVTTDAGAFCIEPCDSSCDTPSFCVGNDLVVCAPDATGCLTPDTRESCGDLTCVEGDASAACIDEPLCSGLPSCDPDDFAERCDRDELIECRRLRAGCFAEVPVNCTAIGEICGVADDGTIDCLEVPCGNGELDGGEECDDGNLFNGDGCDFECSVEPDFFCAGEPSECIEVACGDGEIGTGEGCEDGNTEAGDGCAADCVLEVPDRGGAATIAGSIEAGDETYETPGFECRSGFSDSPYDAYWWRNDTGAAQEVTVELTGEFGHNLVLFNSSWLPGLEPAGCIESVFGGFGDGTVSDPIGLAPGEFLVAVVSGRLGGTPGYSITMRSAGCGDGVIARSLGEACDDGDREDGDGCSATCGIEAGFVCDGEPSECRVPGCGDGIVDSPAEECDDGNDFNGDGCDFECSIEPDSGCTGEPSECFDVVCGDDLIVLTEGCEDGNTEAGDGCSDRCQIELPTGGITIEFEGSLDASDMTWVRPSARCDDGFGDRFFDGFWFINPFDVPVVIDIEVSFGGDGYLHLLEGTFAPEDPTSTCLFGNDDSGGFTTSALTGMTIPAGATRVIAVSSFGAPAIGGYTGTITVR